MGQRDSKLKPGAGEGGKVSKNKTVAHHQTTGTQTVPEQRQALPASSPQLLLLSTLSYHMGHPFGQLGSVVPVLPPRSFLCIPRLLTGKSV